MIPRETVLLVVRRRSGNRGDEVRVTLSCLEDGAVLLGLRKWQTAGRDMVPTREGVAFKATELADLEAAVQRARAMVKGEVTK